MRTLGSRLAGGPARIEVTGTLAPFAGAFREALTERGFARWAVAQHTHLMAHLSLWLEAQGLVPGQLTADVVHAFLAARRGDGHWFLVSKRGLVPLLEYLHGRGVIPAPSAPTPVGPVEELLVEYRDYLVAERGLAPLSVLRYLGTARLFLSTLACPLDATLRDLSAGQVTGFLVDEVGRRRTWSAKSLVTALRSLLGFLHIAGHVPLGLGTAVPSVAGWGLRALPRGIGNEQVAAMLTGCDRSTAMGRRDYAILVLLSRLGLRNGEVARLEFGDIDWHAGEVLIRGKGNRHEKLPLPTDVGRALVDYLTAGRPAQVGCRRLFVIGRAPFTGLTLSAMVSIVVAAGARAAVAGQVSPHRLRHTVASDLLARGASLVEVGQLLRHRAEATTAIYAKLDHLALRELAQPWPGVVTALRQRAEEYLSLRRALGYKLVEFEHLLMQFIGHLEHAGMSLLTTEAAVAWARQPVQARPTWWRRRLSVVRSFARHLHTLEPATEVPPARLLRCFPNRTPPHLYSGEDISALTWAAGRFRQPLRAATYRTLIGLLAVTGLRIGEVVRLNCNDVDLDSGVVTVVDSKFGKSRQVLLHSTTVTALRDYARLRDRAVGARGAPAFFVSTKGRLLVNTVDYTFAALVEAAGIATRPGVRRPRLHDFRHSFAVSTLLGWYRTGVDVQSRLPVLSTWLGHVSPASTYWYLQAAPELLALAAARLEHPLGGSS